MRIGFSDDKDGFYQVEVESEDQIPDWAMGMRRLTEEERLAQLVEPE